MTVYIRNFKFTQTFFTKKQLIKVEYYTGYKWKNLSIPNPKLGENLTIYSGTILKAVREDLTKGQTELFDKNKILKQYEETIMCLTQLNPNLFSKATKLFS